MDKVKAALQPDSEKLLQLKEEIKVLTEKVKTLRKDSNTFFHAGQCPSSV